ncbi:DUF2975 domain-containing protein [Paenibacillus sp. NAIST15-1]|uniref:DUF2975 domain-containing protein n=1 Tax=Paenibacillus sp. NAIST15-1 TaxID=1605994 RepID=UPI000869BEB0|nr:DUF2975 domain-containing protein [Paenibacillus sp. NAIST15-1]GAV13653.1 hypothetical protein PBN151_3590 [Paenibacillus sp. NAIST15-1]
MSTLKIQKTSKILAVCLRMLCIMLLLVTIVEIVAILWLSQMSGDEIPAAINTMSSIFLHIDHSDYAKSDLIITFSGDVVRLCLIMVILFIAGGIFKDISKDYTPFVAKHMKRLKRISLLIAGIAIIPGFVEIAMIQMVTPAARVNVSFELFYILVAVVFFCLAQIFDYGRMLQQQSDETL